MAFYADLHIHSKYSRATSRNCDLEHLYLWARKKGIGVVATGDFTHPGWLGELKEKLVPAEPGLFRLRPDIEQAVSDEVPVSCRGTTRPTGREATRFMLSVEISTIYKKGERAGGERTRKVHHVIYAPDFEHVAHLIESLSRIGNLTSDGRPILGLDSRDLLEITLEAGDGAYLVPAHLWTPWFSVLGSKSGFDSIEECYADLAPHIFAEETGLSTDPPMHWRVSSLDRYRLVSNSDAHSPPKLGRNACVFECAPDYFAMRHALETGEGYGGTIEFYPEEGKYHLDGHRKCGVRLTPAETRKHGGRCPVCGKPVTVGVLYRVEELADRPEGEYRADTDPFRSLIPLPEVLSELEGVGSGSKRVSRAYEGLLARLGPELDVLAQLPLDEVAQHASPRLVEALRRMRAGEVIREAGYDGEFGVIRLFTPEELAAETATLLLFPDDPGKARSPEPIEYEPDPSPLPVAKAAEGAPPAYEPTSTPAAIATGNALLDGLDPEQRMAAETLEGPLLIVAGPGTGKTRTVTHRMAHLISDHGVPPEACLAITFTRRAAAEMGERLERLLPQEAGAIAVRTFHALGLELMREQVERLGLPPNFAVAGDAERQAVLAQEAGCSVRKAAKLVQQIATAKRQGTSPERSDVFDAYQNALRTRALVDFEDLLRMPVELLEQDAALVETYRDRFRWITIDEYQDIDALQYRLIRLLAPADGNLCAIGDPDQAIYSFRGADVGFFKRFEQDYPAARVVRLKHSYRCTRKILDASAQVMAGSGPIEERLEALLDSPDRIVIHEAPTDKAEAEFVVHTIEQLLGGHTFFSLDSGRSDGDSEVDLTFADFAVLYRVDAQADALCEAFARSGIPYQRRSHRRLADEPLARQLTTMLRSERGAGPVRARLREAGERLTKYAAQHNGQLGPDWAWPDAPPQSDDAAADIEGRVAAVVAVLEPLAAQCGEDLDRFLDELALGAELDCWDPRAERVSLLTLHAAKGLEFGVVFIVGCEDALLPLTWGGRSEPAQQEEERRLFYVGMTRARRRLLLSHAGKRFWRGKVRKAAPSPFLREIEEQLLERRKPTPLKRRNASPEDRQLDLF